MQRPRVLHVTSSNERRGAEVYATLVARDGPERPFDHRVHALHWREPADGSAPVPIARLPRITPGPAILGLLVPRLGPNVARLASLVRRQRPAAVVAHGGIAPHSVGLAALLAPSPAYVLKNITRDGFWLRGGLPRPGRALLSRFAGVVFYSEAARHDFVSAHGWQPRHAAIIPNARTVGPAPAPEVRESARRDLGVGPTTLLVAWIGALSPEKDPLAALGVMVRLVASGVDARLAMAGDGPLAAAVDVEARAIGIADRVARLGTRSDIAPLLGAADVFLSTSRVEGVSGALIEAGLAGRPAVCFDTGDDEVLVHGETGFLVPGGDVAGLAARLRELALDPERGAEMGRSARRRCAQRYDVARAARLWDEFLVQVVEASRRG